MQSRAKCTDWWKSAEALTDELCDATLAVHGPYVRMFPSVAVCLSGRPACFEEDDAMVSRRKVIAGLMSAGMLATDAKKGYAGGVAASPDLRIPRSGEPSKLRITDMRFVRLKDVPHASSIIRIDTNQGISGWGEVRDGASPFYAMMLKSRLLGENPCDVDRLFRKVKQFGGHGRQGGGVSAVEMALWDLAGKAYGVPVYQLLGGRFRETVRVYTDCRQPVPPGRGEKLTGHETGRVLRTRMESGITWLKCDVGIGLLKNIPGTLSQPYSSGESPSSMTPHPFNGIELTPKGVELLAGYIADIREIIGLEVPLAIDHLGNMSVSSVIRLSKALEPFALAWIEDPIPWQFSSLLREVTRESPVPILTGEDIFLKEGFQSLVNDSVVDMIHPDLATAGGLLETKKIGDLAMDRGIPMAIHCAGTPIQFMASVHCAAACENFLCLEHHAHDVAFWQDLCTGPAGPLIDRGHVRVPEVPGLGVELNEDVVREHLDSGEFFAPTPEWDTERSWDRTWS